MAQDALIHHTRAHALAVQAKIDALATSIVQESRRAAERCRMSDQTTKALSEETANHPVTLRKTNPIALRMNLDEMRIEAATCGKLSTGKVDGKSAKRLRAS